MKKTHIESDFCQNDATNLSQIALKFLLLLNKVIGLILVKKLQFLL